MVQAPSPQGDDTSTQDTVADQFEDVASRILGSDEEQPEKDEQQDPAEPELDDDAKAEPEEGAEDEETSDTTDDEKEPEPEADQLYTVTLPGGKEEKVTLEELQQGYSRTADYTRKNQANAEKSKTLDKETVAVRESRSRYITLLEQAELAVRALAPDTEPDWAEMRRTLSAEEVLEAQDNHRKYTNRLSVLKGEIEKERQAQFADAEKVADEVKTAENEKLLAAFPEWKDEAKLDAGLKRVVEYARSLGVEDDQLRKITDHRLIVILDKARRWDALRAGKPQGGKQGKPGVRPVTPGTPSGKKPDVNQTNKARAIAKLKQSGRQADAAAVFENLNLD